MSIISYRKTRKVRIGFERGSRQEVNSGAATVLRERAMISGVKEGLDESNCPESGTGS